jgi:hypothetical protein
MLFSVKFVFFVLVSERYCYSGVFSVFTRLEKRLYRQTFTYSRFTFKQVLSWNEITAKKLLVPI